MATQPRVLVEDWYKDDQSKLRVKSTVEEILDQNSPDTYDRASFIAKRDRIFNLIYSRASAGQKWVA